MRKDKGVSCALQGQPSIPHQCLEPSSCTGRYSGVFSGRLGRGARACVCACVCMCWGHQLFRPAVSDLALCSWPIKFPPQPYQAGLA